MVAPQFCLLEGLPRLTLAGRDNQPMRGALDAIEHGFSGAGKVPAAFASPQTHLEMRSACEPALLIREQTFQQHRRPQLICGGGGGASRSSGGKRSSGSITWSSTAGFIGAITCGLPLAFCSANNCRRAAIISGRMVFASLEPPPRVNL